MAYAHPMGRTVWGANIAYLSVDGFDVRDTNGIPQDDKTTQLRDGFVSVGLARSFWYEKFFVGGALRVVHEGIEGAQVTSVHDTLVADVGFLLKPNNVLSLGLAIQNFGSSVENVPGITRRAAFKISEFINLSLGKQGRRPGSASAAEFGSGAVSRVGQLTFGPATTTDNHGQSFDDTLKCCGSTSRAG